MTRGKENLRGKSADLISRVSPACPSCDGDELPPGQMDPRSTWGDKIDAG